jgi:hypothetical protein
MVEGVLKGATRCDGNEVERFQVDIEFVHFLNTSRRPVTAAQGVFARSHTIFYIHSQRVGVSGDPSPKRKRTAFTYGEPTEAESSQGGHSPSKARKTQAVQNAGGGSSSGSSRSK